MSAANGVRGNGRMAEFQRRVSEAAGCRDDETLPYAPDFLDSVVCRMANPGDMAERTFAWTLYRASGNQSEHAVHLYGKKRGNTFIIVETILRQKDCGLELAWLEAGHPAEWLDAPLVMFREEATRRGVTPIEKSLVCDGFTENRGRGTIAGHTGHRLQMVASPKVGDSTNRIGEFKAKTTTYKDYCAKWKVAHYKEYEEEQVARSIIKRNNRLRLSGYRAERRSAAPQTNGTPSLETVEALEFTPAPQTSGSSRIETTSPSSSRENDDDGGSVWSKSTDKLVNDSKTEAKTPDPEFRQAVIRAFVKGGKPSPTLRQILDLQLAIPDEPQARIAFLPYLSEKMSRIRHPGSLPSVAEEFTAAWPALVAREQTIQDSARRSAPEVLTAETLRVYLEGYAATVPFPEIADTLRRLAADVEEHYKDLHSLEQKLTCLEKEMMAIIHNRLTEQQMAEVTQKTDGQLKEYRGRMTTAQLSTLEKQFLERNILEKVKMPRLSLYYIHETARQAVGD